MSCFRCRRTVVGAAWYLWGLMWWKATGGRAVEAYLKNRNNRLARWLVEQYGCMRNPEWPSKNEIKFCGCVDESL